MTKGELATELAAALCTIMRHVLELEMVPRHSAFLVGKALLGGMTGIEEDAELRTPGSAYDL